MADLRRTGYSPIVDRDCDKSSDLGNCGIGPSMQ